MRGSRACPIPLTMFALGPRCFTYTTCWYPHSRQSKSSMCLMQEPPSACTCVEFACRREAVPWPYQALPSALLDIQ